MKTSDWTSPKQVQVPIDGTVSGERAPKDAFFQVQISTKTLFRRWWCEDLKEVQRLYHRLKFVQGHEPKVLRIVRS